MRYLLDSDVLIQAARVHYQMSFCPAFWDWIDKEHQANKVFSISDVLKEITDGKYGSLIPWATKRNGFFLNSRTEKTMPSLFLLAKWVKRYDEACFEKFFKGADFALVGFAHANGYTVVTQETKGGTSVIKVPDACDGMGVECINTWDLLARECPKFILA